MVVFLNCFDMGLQIQFVIQKESLVLVNLPKASKNDSKT